MTRGKPFVTGNTANKGGRPPKYRALSETVRDTLGRDGWPLVAFHLAVFYGDPEKVLRDEQDVPLEITLDDRRRSADWLADRGWGKAPQHAPIEDGDPLALDAIDRDIEALLAELSPRGKDPAALAATNGSVGENGSSGAAPA